MNISKPILCKYVDRARSVMRMRKDSLCGVIGIIIGVLFTAAFNMIQERSNTKEETNRALMTAIYDDCNYREAEKLIRIELADVTYRNKKFKETPLHATLAEAPQFSTDHEVCPLSGTKGENQDSG